MTGGQYMAAYIERKDNDYVVKVIESYGGDLDKKERVIGEYSFGDICKKYGCSIEEGLKNIRFSMLFDNDNVENSDDLFFKNVDDKENAPVLRIYLKLNDDTDLLKAVDLNVRYTPSDHTWVGAKIGIFALTSNVSSNADNSGYADFISVDVTKI